MHEWIEPIPTPQEEYAARLNARASSRGAEARDRALRWDDVAPARAADAAFSYYAVPLSQNIARTSEGYLICKDAVIGRTGKMQYMVGQLHSGQLLDLGLGNRYKANDTVDVWRDPEEVFAPGTLASFEGKPVTDNHPKEFVDVENIGQHHCGHVQNVRAGTTPLPTGDLPILADLMITDSDLAGDIVARRKRQLSCGYNYHLAYEGARLSQVNITGNHVAVVAKGRAGDAARINDEAPNDYIARLNDRARRRASGELI
jgi:uncharacterized protein